MKSRSSLPVRVGIFSKLSQADRAVDRLLREGFPKESITVIAPSTQTGGTASQEVPHTDPAGSHTATAVTSGGVIGAALGGMLALAGITATGGLPLLVIGPLVAGAATGAMAGGFIGAMMTRGFEKEVANFYDQAVQSGKILVSVEDESEDADTRLRRAEAIFESAGAEPIALPEG